MSYPQNDPGDEWWANDSELRRQNIESAIKDLEAALAKARGEWAGMDIFGIYGIPVTPDPMTESEIRDTLRGAAGDAEQTIDSAPCEEHKDMIRQGADLFRKVAQDIEDVQKARK